MSDPTDNDPPDSKDGGDDSTLSAFGTGGDAKEVTDLANEVRAGAWIGNYKLLEQLGEGGFGAVWMAEQLEPIRRRVALKVVKLGMDSEEVVARFEAERQALALMNHPNIAKVFDAGTTEKGRPYFVMEYVKGRSVTEFCWNEELDTNARLELFKDICDGLSHAHAKGIIHRDLKPSNIMVGFDGDAVRPKIIDFGIAKALAQQLTDKIYFTRLDSLIGTPAYMSPEQASGDPDIDTLSDVYSLGVLLYELLAGLPPFDEETLEKAAVEEVRRIIREDEPPKPSTRAETIRGSEVGGKKGSSLVPAASLKGELDWIVLKAIEKDRSRRYKTADAFKIDIVNYLTNEPVLAAPPGKFYRIGKFIRKHKAGVAAGVAVMLAIFIGSATTLYQRNVARKERKNAEVQRERSEDILVDTLGKLERWLKKYGTNSDLTEVSKMVAAYYADYDDPSLTRKQRRTRAWAAVLHGDVYVYSGDSAKALAPYDTARGLFDDLIVEESEDKLLSDLAVCWGSIGKAMVDSGQGKGAGAAYDSALQILGDLTIRNPDKSAYKRELAVIYSSIAELRLRLKEHEKAAEHAEEALRIRKELVARDDVKATWRADLASSHRLLTALYQKAGELDDAETACEEAIAAYESVVEEDPDNAKLLADLASCYAKLGNIRGSTGRERAAPDEAVSLLTKSADLRRLLVERDPENALPRYELAVSLILIGNLQLKAGSFDKAEPPFKEAAKQIETALERNPDKSSWRRHLGMARFRLAQVRGRLGRGEDTIATYRDVISALDPLEKADNLDKNSEAYLKTARQAVKAADEDQE